MNVPLPAPATAELPFWTYVVESYEEAFSKGHDIFIPNIIAVLVLLFLSYFIPLQLADILNVTSQMKGSKPSPEETTIILKVVFKIVGLFLLMGIVGWQLHARFLAWKMRGDTKSIVIPFIPSRQTWCVLWYALKAMWYLSLPILLYLLTLIVVQGIIAGVMIAASVGGATTGPALIVGFVMLLVNLVCSIFFQIWMARRTACLHISMAGIFDDPVPRMWKDVWVWTKGNRWRIFGGSLLVTGGLSFLGFLSGLLGKKMTPLIAAFLTNNMQVIQIVFVLSTVLGVYMALTNACYTARCYAFLKNNKPAV
jgi:hypothetical protein